MIMRILWSLLVFQGCSVAPQLPVEESMVQAVKIVVSDGSYYRDPKQPIKVDSVGGAFSPKDVRAKILLVAAPFTEEISSVQGVNVQPFRVRLSPDKRSAFLQPIKHFKADAVYGLYIKQAHGPFLLVYTFALKPDAPHMIRHDVGQGEQPLVSDRRTRFSFYFDKPVVVHQHSLILKDLGDHQVVPFERIELNFDRKTITAIVGKDAQGGLRANHAYGFFANEASALSDNRAQSGPIAQFQAVKDTPSFFAWQKPAVSSSESAAALSLHFNKPFIASWYVEEEHAGVNDAYGLHSWVGTSASLHNPHAGFNQNVARLAVTGLKAKTRYKYVARITNEEGGVVIRRGDFISARHHPLRIAGVMANPQVSKDEHEQDFEYVKIANISDEKISIKNLYLKIENPYTGQLTDCAVVSPHAPLEVVGGEYFLVVGQGFKALESGFGPEIKLVRLKQGTLCGGLHNTHSRIITIHEDDGGFIDSYGGHLRGSPEGYSIERIDLEGLDEENNYCYLPSAKLAPRPMKSLCGT